MAPFSQIALFLLRASLFAPSVEVRADDIQFRPTDLFDQGVGEDQGVEVDSATLIITMKEGNGGENPSLDAYCENTLLSTLTGCKTAVFLEQLDICILTFRDRDSAQAARDTTNMSPFIAASELPARFTMAEEPNDPRFNEQWGATDVDLPAAWEIFSGASQDKLIVAVVDTGVDYTHPDLKNHMWQGEAKGGYDFVADSPDPMDSHGHGTHCAGIIAAQGNNKLGVTGALLSGVQIMALKVSTKKGYFKDAAILKAMNYALRHKVRISSHSYSTTNNVDVFHRVADAAIKNNHLMIIAAGNDGKSLEEEKAYPCCLASSSIICVAAVDKNLSLRKYSNYGTTCVDIAAPGEDILSTKTGGGYETRSGTSFASPIVAGVAALALGFRSNLPASALKQAIQNGVKPDARLKDKVKWGGRVNALVVLAILSARVPEYAPPMNDTSPAPPMNGTSPEPPMNDTSSEPPMNGTSPDLPINGSCRNPPINGSCRNPPINGTSPKPPMNGTDLGSRDPSVSTLELPPHQHDTGTVWYIMLIIAVIVLVQLGCVAIAWRYKKNRKAKAALVISKMGGQPFPNIDINRVATKV